MPESTPRSAARSWWRRLPVVLLAGCLVAIAPLKASAEVQNFLNQPFWYRTAQVNYSAQNSCGNFEQVPLIGVRPSMQIGANRLPRSSEPFYLQLEVAKLRATCATMDPDVTITVTLPEALRLATDSEPYQCYQRDSSSNFVQKACNFYSTGGSSYYFNAAFDMFNGAYYRFLVPVRANYSTDFAGANVNWRIDAVAGASISSSLSYPVLVPNPATNQGIAYWELHGGPSSKLGLPTSYSQDYNLPRMGEMIFDTGYRVRWQNGFAARAISPDFYHYYNSAMGPATSDVQCMATGCRVQRQYFLYGYITHDSNQERTYPVLYCRNLSSMDC